MNKYEFNKWYCYPNTVFRYALHCCYIDHYPYHVYVIIAMYGGDTHNVWVYESLESAIHVMDKLLEGVK